MRNMTKHLVRRWMTAVLMAFVIPAAPVLGQSTLSPVVSPILTLNSDRLLTESAAGQAIEAELSAKSTELAAENRRLEAELADEEKALTERRKTMQAEAFRAEAAAFDAKVQKLREQQDTKLRALRDQSNEAQRKILSAADPILRQIMAEAGAAVILERSTVLAAANAIDVTTLAIARLDAALGQELGDDQGSGGQDSGLDTGTPAAPTPETASGTASGEGQGDQPANPIPTESNRATVLQIAPDTDANSLSPAEPRQSPVAEPQTNADTATE